MKKKKKNIRYINIDEFVNQYEEIYSKLSFRKRTGEKLTAKEESVLSQLRKRLDILMPVDRAPGFKEAMTAWKKLKKQLKEKSK